MSEMLLQGLTCAHCAGEIEHAVGKLPGVTSAQVSLPTQKLVYETHSEADPAAVEAQVVQVVRDIEPQVRVLPSRRAADGHGRGRDHAADAHAHAGDAHIHAGDGAVCGDGDACGCGHDHASGGEKAWVMPVRIGASLALLALGMLLPVAPWARIALHVAGWAVAGYDVFYRAGRNLLRGRMLDENFLMAVASIGAFALGDTGEGLAVMVFYQVGEWFQALAVGRSRKAITGLMDLRPDSAHLIAGSGSTLVHPSDVPVGAEILVLPGEKVPLDGVVTDGVSQLDTSAMTGESLPREAETGAEVLSGFVNGSGTLRVRVTAAFSQSTASRILDLVQDASARKSPTESFITKFARVYTPIIVGAAALLAVLPPLLLPGASFSTWLYRALTFLVISCPCALVVSVPLGIFAGIGSASRKGILVKGGNSLESLARLHTVVFDKTGTLTEGRFEVTRIQAADGVSQDDLLEAAALAEAYSRHPLADAVRAARPHPSQTLPAEAYEELPGRGIQVRAASGVLLAGNVRLMQEAGVDLPAGLPERTAIHVARDGRYLGFLEMADQPRADAAATLQTLRQQGVERLEMLSGDAPQAAQAVATRLGLDGCQAGLLPDGKVEAVEAMLQAVPQGRTLAFVGDGTNDAPVLALADIGVAMGMGGTDSAIEAADVVLMHDAPSDLPRAVRVSRRTRRIVWENITLALAAKGVILILGALGYASMWLAVFADVGIALLAVLNALRALK